ncbi:hypothetical protein CALCODRAFT_114267 [Calocera cornea HHB12733]|uniref:Uncharacterized protein n=1 Tax=Calocera cornea HHB12733 TaxID=1353952 RepID=A0A165CZS4_9BASI|nr:hypothetical protein CALCODRAFT_114267 [Calocera cornea HHB12733]
MGSTRCYCYLTDFLSPSYYMAHQGQNMTPKQLIEAYAKERTSLLNRGRKSRLTSLDVSITLSINCHTMRDEPNAMEARNLLSTPSRWP